MAGQVDVALAEAARGGDPDALGMVAQEYLPLVYTIVRRSLRSSADVDDVVQDTMLQLVRGVGGLRDPARLRAWLVAVTVNQIRAHQRARGPVEPFSERFDLADPRSEFEEPALVRMDLSAQRRETARATSWLDPDQRELLALWWLEASGHLSRAELVDALGQDPHHVTVRISRMKEQLDGSRLIVRALSAEPRCPGFDEIAAVWEGEADSVWRKRFLRHVRICAYCGGAAASLFPPESLLAGLPLLVPAMVPLAAAPAPTTSGAAGSSNAGAAGRGGRHGSRHGRKATRSIFTRPLAVLGAPVAVVAIAATVIYATKPAQTSANVAIQPTQAVAGAAASPSSSPKTLVVPSASLSVARSASRPASAPPPSPTKHPVTTSAPASSPSTGSGGGTSGSTSAEQYAADQVLDVINNARTSAGLTPYTMSSALIRSAGAHNTLMSGGCGLSHQCSGEPAIGNRVSAVGVQWTACGENIGDGGPEPDTRSGLASMAVGLTNSMLAEQPPDDGHRLNILSSSFTEVGIAVMIDAKGTVWMTQDFAN